MSTSARRLGANVKRIRLGKGMTQGDLCKKLNIDAPYLSNLENGKKNPTLATVDRIAKALGVTLEQLVK